MHNFLIGPTDTDSISFCKPDGSEFSKEELDHLLEELNNISPEFMVWEDDGYYKTCIALRAKNYMLWDGKDKKIKGSAFKTSSKEPILKQFMNDIIDCLLEDKIEKINDVYTNYIKKTKKIEDIKDWATKKTITKSILNCKGYTEQDILDKKVRRNETVIWDALKNKHVQEGDKVYLYPAILGTKITSKPINKKGEVVGYKEVEEIVYGLKLIEDYNDDADVEQLIKRVYDTLKIFKTVINMDNYINYNLVKNKKLLDNL